MIVKIKDLYKGQIPLRDKYVDEAVKLGVDITVVTPNKAYILTVQDLRNPVRSIIVDDKFSKNKQKLYYYLTPGQQVIKTITNDQPNLFK